MDDVRDAFVFGARNGASNQQLAQEENVIYQLKRLGLPGRLGSGEYSQPQLEIFADIQSAFSEGKPVTISTHKYMIAQEGHFSGYAGEQKAGGLAGRHAYTVLDTLTSDSLINPETAKNDKGKYKLIKLRNPWGEYGRYYKDLDKGGVIGKAKEKGDGIFWD